MIIAAPPPPGAKRYFGKCIHSGETLDGHAWSTWDKEQFNATMSSYFDYLTKTECKCYRKSQVIVLMPSSVALPVPAASNQSTAAQPVPAHAGPSGSQNPKRTSGKRGAVFLSEDDESDGETDDRDDDDEDSEYEREGDNNEPQQEAISRKKQTSRRSAYESDADSEDSEVEMPLANLKRKRAGTTANGKNRKGKGKAARPPPSPPPPPSHPVAEPLVTPESLGLHGELLLEVEALPEPQRARRLGVLALFTEFELALEHNLARNRAINRDILGTLPSELQPSTNVAATSASGRPKARPIPPRSEVAAGQATSSSMPPTAPAVVFQPSPASPPRLPSRPPAQSSPYRAGPFISPRSSPRARQLSPRSPEPTSPGMLQQLTSPSASTNPGQPALPSVPVEVSDPPLLDDSGWPEWFELPYQSLANANLGAVFNAGLYWLAALERLYRFASSVRILVHLRIALCSPRLASHVAFRLSNALRRSRDGRRCCAVTWPSSLPSTTSPSTSGNGGNGGRPCNLAGAGMPQTARCQGATRATTTTTTGRASSAPAGTVSSWSSYRCGGGAAFSARALTPLAGMLPSVTSCGCCHSWSHCKRGLARTRTTRPRKPRARRGGLFNRMQYCFDHRL